MAGNGAAHAFEVAFQRLRELGAILDQFFGLLGNGAPDRGEVGFQRALEDIAALGQLLDLPGDQTVDARTAFGELGEVFFEGLRQLAAFFRQPVGVAGNRAAYVFEVAFQRLRELRTILQQLVRLARKHGLDGLKVGFQRPLEDVAAFGQLLDLSGDQAVDAGAAFGELGKIRFQGPRKQAAVARQSLRMVLDQLTDTGKVGFQRFAEVAAILGQLGGMAVHQGLDGTDVGFQRAGERRTPFGDLFHLSGDQPVDIGPALGQLAEVGFEGAGEDAAALDQLSDMAGNHFVNDRTSFDQFLGVFVERIGQLVSAILQALELLAERFVHRRARGVHLTQVLFERARDQVTAFGEFLDLAGDDGIDAGTAFREFVEIGLQGGRHALAAFRELAAVFLDGVLDAGTRVGEAPDIAFERTRDSVASRFHAAGKVAGVRFEQGGCRGDDASHLRADLRLALVDHGRQRVLAAGEGIGDIPGPFDQRLVDLARARFQRRVQLLRAGIERLGTGLELADERLAALGQRPFDAFEAVFEFAVKRARCAAQQRHHAGRTVVQQIGQRAGQPVGAVRQLGDAGVQQAGERLAGRGEPVGDGIQATLDGIEDRHRACVDAIDQRVAGIGDRHRQVGGGTEDAVADGIASRVDFFLQGLVSAHDRGAYALGVADDRLAFTAEPIDQRADARLVFRIGSLDLADFAVDQRFQFHGPRQSPLDAFAHRCHLAAHGLADHHHPVLREVLRFGQPEGDFRHRLGRDAHVLRAADHGGECPEQDDGQDRRDGEADQARPFHQLVERTDFPDIGAEQHVGKGGSARDPRDGDEGDDPINGRR